MTDPQQVQLDYAPPLKLAQKRWWRLALALVVLLPLLWLGYYKWPDLQRRLEFLQLQRACMNHADPAGTLLFEQTPDDNAAREPGFGGNSARTLPQWDSLLQTRHEGRLAGDFLFLQSSATLFVHGRRATPASPVRIVGADLALGWLPELVTVACDVRVVEPGNVARPRVRLIETPGDPRIDLLGIPFGHAFRLYGGRADPKDESRFAIDYEADGQRGTIEGKLMTDDSVQFRFVGSPPPPPFKVRLSSGP